MKLTQNNGKHNISITTGTITALDINVFISSDNKQSSIKKIDVLGKCKKELFF